MRDDWELDIKWNVKLFRIINNKRNKFLDKFYKYYFRLGKSYTLPAFLPAFYYFGKWQAIFELSIALIIAGILMPAIKYILKHKRPPSLMKNVHLLEPVSLKSFPSADTAYAFTLLGISIFFFPPWVKFTMCIYAFLIAYGRIYMGAHFPLDVLVGAILGFLFAIVSHTIFTLPWYLVQ